MKLNDTTAANSFRYKWLLERIYPFIKPYMARVILGFLVAIPVGALDGVVAFFLKPYMDYVVGQKDLIFTVFNHTFSISWSSLALSIPFLVILFAVIQGVLRYLNSYLTDWTSQKITNGVKIALFNKLVYMDTSFFDENTSGVIITRYLTDPDTASLGIVNNLKSTLTSSFGAASLIAVMLYSSWRLAIIGVVVLCIAFVPVAIIRKKIKSTSNKNMVIGGNITTNFNETYAGNKVMRAYGLEERQKTLFNKQIHLGFDNNMSLVKRSGWMSPLMYLIASFGIAIVLGYGTHLITTGEMTAGGFASFVTSLLLLYKPIKTLGQTLTSLQTIFVAMGRVFELFDIKPELTNKQNALNFEGLNNCIEFKNVNFEYVKDHRVLKNINLKINKNETLAIVGNSGGGKSTLVNLLPRFYDVTTGSITIDGIDIKDYSMNSIRKNISMVFQDNFLFSGSIKENILMGKPDATEEELQNAIQYAHLEEMIAELPDGIETLLGERGLTLSGGQRQRVAIARAMIRNSSIVILDEATSALDNKSEAVVQKALDNLIKNKTVFVIAHRLSTIKNANRIAVINDGELVELGSHDELMSIPNGQYKALYDMQFKKQEAVIK
ncbi:MAG: ABC transporter ATP-binding protein [Candidatus Avigastranaerophilus sp.]